LLFYQSTAFLSTPCRGDSLPGIRIRPEEYLFVTSILSYSTLRNSRYSLTTHCIGGDNHQALVKRSIRIRELRLGRKRSRDIPSPHLRLTRPCPPTISFSSVVNTACSSPLNLTGPTTIGTPAYTSHDTIASSVPSRSGPEIVLRHTLSINTQPILRRDNDWTSPCRFLYFRTLGCTPATFLPSVAKAVDTPPPHSANSTSTISFVNYPDDTGAPSARKHSPPAAILKTTYPSNTNFTLRSYTGSNKWNHPPESIVTRPHLNRGPAKSRNPASTSSRGNHSDFSSSGFPTMCRLTMAANINASASSITVHSTIRPSSRRPERLNARRRPFLREG
jgi:hypothetical protein